VNVVLDGLDEFHVLLSGVGVVKAQIALAAELFRHGEIDIQSLDMANVQISVGFGRESGLNLPDHLAFRDILLDEFLNKIRGGFFVCFHEYSLL